MVPDLLATFTDAANTLNTSGEVAIPAVWSIADNVVYKIREMI